MMQIGVLGLGRMGTTFAARLLDNGHSVAVWNRTPGRAGALIANGAVEYPRPADVVGVSEASLTSITDDAALEAVFSGEGGILEADLRGRLIIDTSTVRPATVRALAAHVGVAGGDFVDAPVLGTVGPARAGQVVFVAGGRAEIIEKVRPALACLGRKVVHMGPTGAGSTMKLVVNMHLATYWHSLAESLAAGQRSGLELSPMLQVLEDSPIATAALAAKLPLLLGRSSEVGFDMKGVRKDLLAALDLAGSAGVDACTARSALEGFEDAIKSGHGACDVAAIVEYLSEKG
jgi:3-hydroxyisobutyrate dehydrogenase